MYPTVSLTSQVIRSVTEENCSRCHPSGWVTAETDMFEVAWREKNSIIAMSRLECPDRLIGKSRCRGLNLALFWGGERRPRGTPAVDPLRSIELYAGYPRHAQGAIRYPDEAPLYLWLQDGLSPPIRLESSNANPLIIY